MKIFQLSTYLVVIVAAVMGLASCASREEEPRVAAEGGDTWIAFDISTGGGIGTRAADEEGDAAESAIKSLCIFLVDPQGYIRAAGTPEFAPGQDASNTSLYKNVRVRIPNSFPLSKQTYTLYAVANVPQATITAIYSAAMNGTGIPDLPYLQFTSLPLATASNSVAAITDGIPMATASDAGVTVTLTKDSYPYDDPYKINEDADHDTMGVVELTRMWARLDYEAAAGNTSFDVLTAEGQSEAPLQLIPVDIRPFNMASSAKIIGSDDERTRPDCSKLSPVLSRFVGGVPTAPLSGYNLAASAGVQKARAYMPEFVPASDANLSMSDATGFYITMRLAATDATPIAVKAAIDGTDASHPAIWYYDDGTYQTFPMLIAAGDPEPSGANWHSIVWNDAAAGYTVTYARLIVHSEAEGAAFRYGVMRNNVYRVSINKVYRLPRPEPDPDRDPSIDISISAPNGWTWHRTGEDI